MFRRVAGCTSRCVSAGGRSRSLIGFAVLLFAAGGVVPSAASGFGLPLGDPAMSSRSPAISSGDRDFAAGEQRDQARRERLSSQDAQAQRTRSRSAYRDLGRDEALALAREMFAEQLTGRLFDGARPGRGVRVVDYRGGGSALVEDTNSGRRSLLASTLPLQAKRPDGAYPRSTCRFSAAPTVRSGRRTRARRFGSIRSARRA